jgi:hypothetical protein
MADQKGGNSQQVAGSLPTISRANVITALTICFVAGYFLAQWWGRQAASMKSL